MFKILNVNDSTVNAFCKVKHYITCTTEVSYLNLTQVKMLGTFSLCLKSTTVREEANPHAYLKMKTFI